MNIPKGKQRAGKLTLHLGSSFMFLILLGMLGESSCHETIANEMLTRNEVMTNSDAMESSSNEPVVVHDEMKSSEITCRTNSLLDHQLWKQVSREHDPYKSMAPPNKPCDDVAYKLEDGVIEVETGICSFITVAQPLKHNLRLGDKLKVIFWHLYLTAASSAEGYVGLSIDSAPIYVKKIPIPASPAVYEETITLKRNFSKGETLYFHIHNHGSNTWKLLSLEQICP